MWKRVAVLIMIGLLPVSAVAHTKLFYRQSYRSDYWKVEAVTPELTEIPSVEIPLESILTPEPIPTPIPTETPTEVPTPTLEVVDASEQITTPSDVDTPTTPPEEVL